MLSGQFNDLFQQLFRVHRSRRIIRVDQHNGTGATGDFLFDVVDVREPVLLLVASVVNRLAAGERYCRSPQWVVGCWNQHLIASVQHGLHRHDDHFADAVAQENVVNIHFVDADLLAVMHNRFTGREQAFGFHVTLRVMHVINNVLLDFLRHIQFKCSRVTNVQLEYSVSLLFKATGLAQNNATNFVANVVQLG